MKITGVAPKIAVPTFIYILITVIIDYFTKPLFTITQKNYSAFIAIASILMLIGILAVARVGKKLRKSFSSGTLMNDGLYKIFRNPMYVSYLILIIPGICFLFNSWLVFTSLIINFILFQIFIKEEYKYLEEKYKEEYKSYLDKVLFKFL